MGRGISFWSTEKLHGGILAGYGKWKPVAGYEGYYEVSDCGLVRSVSRDIKQMNNGTLCIHRYKGRVLKPSPGKYGHLRVTLQRCGESEVLLVHRLVLETFAGDCPAGMECCHRNGHPGDNRLSNLRWDTHKENHADSIRNDTQPRGGANGRALLDEWGVGWIRRFLKSRFATPQYLADVFGVSRPTIYAIKQGRNWDWLEVA
jgi:hypothetical protein